MNHKLSNHFSSNSIGKYPLNYSTLISNQSSSAKLKVERNDKTADRYTSQFLNVSQSQ